MLTVAAEEPLRKKQEMMVKSVSFEYSASRELSSLFNDFCLMCNDAIRIAIEGKPKSRFSLIELAYPRLKEYGLHTHYILSACEVAYSVYRNKNRKSVPYVSRAFLKLDNQSYKARPSPTQSPSNPDTSFSLLFAVRNTTSPSWKTRASREAQSP